jgi:Zn-finger in ubiquitin-hydrolases and other protein
MTVCSHLDQVRVLEPPAEIAGCQECLKSGGTWRHLRMCETCGEIGCCDSSPNQHATRHARAEDHPILRSVEPGEVWSWCVIDEVDFILRTE